MIGRETIAEIRFKPFGSAERSSPRRFFKASRSDNITMSRRRGRYKIGYIMTRAATADPFFEKGLPSNLEAERSILGAILLDNTVVNQAIELLRREDFFLDSHRRIFVKNAATTERV